MIYQTECGKVSQKSLIIKNAPTGMPKIQDEPTIQRVNGELKQRNNAKITLRWTICMVFFIDIVKPLLNTRPIGSLTAYLFVGTVIFSVSQSLG